jgi:hypothetical protein
MKRHSLWLACAVALVACETATEPEPVGPDADEAVQQAAATVIPMSDGPVVHRGQLRSEGDLVVIGWCDEAAGVFRAAAPGIGTMTHVGRFEVQQDGCVNPVTGAVTDGQGVLTAANGDEIHLAYSGLVLPGGGFLIMELRYVVTGGTGRFTRAEGGVDVRVTYWSETEWTAEGDGWLAYFASDRRDR